MRAPLDGDAGDTRDPLPIPWDPNEYSAMVCGSCGRPRVFRRPRIHHSLHFMLALGTLGIWLSAWGVAIILQTFKPWSCTVCGARQRRN
jgi:hypothetical protein